MTMEMRIRLAAYAAAALFWTGYGFCVSGIGNNNWVHEVGSNRSFGLFNYCENSTFCNHFSTSDLKIMGSRALIVMFVILSFFGWCMICGLFSRKAVEDVKKTHGLLIMTLMLFVLSSILQFIGVGVWTAYFCAVSCDSYEWSFDYQTQWISGGATGAAAIPIVFGIVWNRARMSDSAAFNSM